MKINKTITIINQGNFHLTAKYFNIQADLFNAIKNVENPDGMGKFVLYAGKKQNGVKPIKEAFQNYLKENGWELEKRLDLKNSGTPGPIDATYNLEDDRYYAVEWETGNISSSHRAINKLVRGLQTGKLVGGTLILPIKNTAQYLTDRVGNFEELEPYFPVWQGIHNIKEGILEIIAIEYDELTDDISYKIQKGKDGMAKK